MLSHLWLKNRSIVSRWKIDYAKLNKHSFLAWVQMSLHHRAKAAARGDEARCACCRRGKGLCLLFSLAFISHGPFPVAQGVAKPTGHQCGWRNTPGKAQAGGCAALLAHRLCGTWLWKSGLIWGPEQNSEKGTGAKTGVITS